MSNNLEALKNFKSNILKNFGKENNIIKNVDDIVIERFSTGNTKLDIELKGGYPKGTYIELYGVNQSGKTTAAIEAAIQFQKKYPDEPILWIDLEKVFEKAFFEHLGLDLNPDKFILVRPSTGEKTYEIMIDFSKSIKGGLVILDSVALLLPEKEDEQDMGAAQMASQARLMSQGLRKLFPHTSKNETTLIFINQVATNIGVMYGDADVTSGGRRLGYYTRTRLKLSKVKGKYPEICNGCNISLVKATFGNEGVKVESHISKNGGFDKMVDLVDAAIDLDVINKSGSWYSYNETKIGQGLQGVIDLLNDNPELLEEIESKIKEKIS